MTDINKLKNIDGVVNVGGVAALEADKLSIANDAEEVTFAKRLRTGTAQAHRIAESTNFVKGILKGVMDLESFANMQAGMYLVYEALEEQLERHKNHPLVSAVHFPELSRKAALESDLEFLYGEDWQSQIRDEFCRSFLRHFVD